MAEYFVSFDPQRERIDQNLSHFVRMAMNF
jgi:hypothetical protein